MAEQPDRIGFAATPLRWIGLVCAVALLGALGLSAPAAAATTSYSLVREWGASGSGPGQFNGPSGVAVGRDGNIYVGDGGNDRVEVFAPNGTYVSQWPTRSSGGASLSPGYMTVVAPTTTTAWNIAISSPVADTVAQFLPDGSLLGSVQLSESPYGLAFSGTNAAYFIVHPSASTDPSDPAYGDYVAVNRGNGRQKLVAVSPDANSLAVGPGSSDPALYVTTEGDASTEATGSSVDVYSSSSGAHLRTVGSIGSGDGQYRGPTGITVDPQGNVFVVDNGNGRVEEFGPDGSFITSFGSHGSEAGQLMASYGIAVDSTGDVFVADLGNDRIDEFAPLPPFNATLALATSTTKGFSLGVSCTRSCTYYIAAYLIINGRSGLIGQASQPLTAGVTGRFTHAWSTNARTLIANAHRHHQSVALYVVALAVDKAGDQITIRRAFPI